MLWWLLACGPDDLTTDLWLPPTGVPVVVDEPIDSNAWRFDVLLPEPALAQVRCILDIDPAEVHTGVGESERLQTIEMFGLLANADYTCTVSADDWSMARSIHTDRPPEGVPLWEVTVPGPPPGAYVLLNHGYTSGGRRESLLVIDGEGRLRWHHPVPENPPDLDAQYLGGGQVLFGGGFRTAPTVVDLAHRVILQAPPPFTGGVFHHHVERLDSLEVATLVTDRNHWGAWSWQGFGVSILTPTLATPLWTFESQTLVDSGELPIEITGEDDPYHANALIERDGVVYVNLRQNHRLLAIERRTGDLLWTFGPDGDFELLEGDWAYGMHAPELDGNRLLAYDNGYGRPDFRGSRLVEFELDVDARQAWQVWEYTESKWYEPIWGDVDRLPDGRVMFVRGHCASCLSVSDLLRTEVVTVDPATDTVDWRLTMTSGTSASYRAEAIGGCDVFANALYCPDLE